MVEKNNAYMQQNPGRGRFPALDLVRAAPQDAAVISKLVNPKVPQTDMVNRAVYAQAGQMHTMSQEVQTRISDNKNIVQIFPDIELAIQILVSSILSPKDMMEQSLIYRFSQDILASDVAASVITEIRTHLDGYHKVGDRLPQMLREMLFTHGSYIRMTLPEAAVDEIINQPRMLSLESLQEVMDVKTGTFKPMGYLGDPDATSTKVALEDYLSNNFSHATRDYPKEQDISYEGLVRISDNPFQLKMPKVMDQMRQQKVKEMSRPSVARMLSTRDKLALESAATQTVLTNSEFRTALFKGAQQTTATFIRIPERENLKRRSIGRPLDDGLPSEAVMPVFMPGNETDPLGYFVLTDDEGHALSMQSQRSIINGASGIFASAQTSSSTSTTVTSRMIDRAKQNLVGNQQVTHLDQLSLVAGQIVEQDLIKRFRNGGVYSTDVVISRNEDVYRMMIARSFQSLTTRLVFVPKEMMSYFAFEYHENGIGKSLLDDIRMLLSMRAMLLFSKVQAEVRSSISVTEVNIELDPRSPDPIKDIEMSVDLISKTRQQYFPLGVTATNELLEWTHRAGFEIHFSGHPGLPQTKYNFSPKNFDRQIPNNELDETLRKQTYMAFGLPPELMDTGFDAEFATAVTANNILFSQRIVSYQNRFSKQLSGYGHNLLLNDMTALSAVLAILEQNWPKIEGKFNDDDKRAYEANPHLFKEQFLERVVKDLELDFPRPETTSLTNQFEAFKKYEEAVDEGLKYWLSADIMSADLVGDVAEHIDAITSTVKAHFMRAWMAREGFLPEMAEIVTIADDKSLVLDIYEVTKDHMTTLMRNAVKFVRKLTAARAATNTDVQALQLAEGGGGGFGSGGDDGGDDGGGGGFPDMDFSMDPEETPPGEDDAPKDTPPDDAPPEEPPAAD